MKMNISSWKQQKKQILLSFWWQQNGKVIVLWDEREREVTLFLSFKLYILLCLMRWWKRLAIQNFLREFLIENNFVTLSPYLGYHINLTRAGSATKKELICTHHEKAHKSVSFVSSYDERTNDFTLKAFNSYKLSSSRHQTTTIKKSRENEANFFISTKFNNGWISYHDTYLHLSLSSLHIHWYCSFSHSILMPVLFAWERDFFLLFLWLKMISWNGCDMLLLLWKNLMRFLLYVVAV